MSKTTQMTFVGFLLAVSTLSVSAAQAHSLVLMKGETETNIEYRLSRLTNAMQQRGITQSNCLETEGQIVAGFANRSGGGGFVNRYRGGFANRSGGGGFVNRSPWRNGGGFYNRY
ncbi:MAG: GrrA/OscA1 family cyclophane-containing rSAM-modified RiPP [Microcystaceae cyanobacterium]